MTASPYNPDRVIAPTSTAARAWCPRMRTSGAAASLRALAGSTLLVVAAGLVATSSGCAQPFLWWSQDKPVVAADDGPEEWENDIKTKFIADVASPWNINFLKVEAVGFVSELADTGSNPPDSTQRDSLLNEMRSHDVAQPEKQLALKTTSLVLVRGFIPPGAKPGDRFDLEVVLPPGSETISLAGGWLFHTRLRQQEFLGGAVRTGEIMASGEGKLLVDAVLDPKSPSIEELTTECRNDGRIRPGLVHAVIPGGGIVRKERTIGLTVRGDRPSESAGAMVATAVNRRFAAMTNGRRETEAKMQNGRTVTLGLPQAYRRHPDRFYRVLGQIALTENQDRRMERLALLEKQLNEPTSSGQAAVRLEAMGRQAIRTLESGLKSPHQEVRYFASESLAYLDQKPAVEHLVAAAQEIPSVRPHALIALAAMTHLEAREALDRFLEAEDPALRMAAFRVIVEADPDSPYVAGEYVRSEYHLHHIHTTASPLIHIGNIGRADFVIFGQEQPLNVPAAGLFLGKGIMIQGLDDRHLRVSRFRAGAPDVQLETSNRLVEVCQAVSHLGGEYADLVRLLREADRQRLVPGQLATNLVQTSVALAAKPDFTESSDGESKSRLAVQGGPLPPLFEDRLKLAAEFEARSKSLK